jgi:transposase
MRFYTKRHEYYCGIDLHAKKMYVCVVDGTGTVLLHRNIATEPERFLAVIAPYRGRVVVAVEAMFCWYWLKDVCEREGVAFVLGHPLYMKAISGGKAKNDKIDSLKLAMMVKGGLFPLAYAYPKEMRATRDLMRRRLFFVNKRAELIVHLEMTHQQYNVPNPGRKLKYRGNREGLAKAFSDESVRYMVESDARMAEYYTEEIGKLEWYIRKNTNRDPVNAQAVSLLKTVPGIGDVLGLTLLYEIHTIERFPTVQQFSSYARLVKPEKTSSGKRVGSGGGKIGNPHLKWAFSEAAVLLLRSSEEAKKYLTRLQKKHSKAKALSILAHKLGIAIYFMLKRKEGFNPNKFFAH